MKFVFLLGILSLLVISCLAERGNASVVTVSRNGDFILDLKQSFWDFIFLSILSHAQNIDGEAANVFIYILYHSGDY